LTEEEKSNKGKNKIVSLPRRLAEDIQVLIDESGYWLDLDEFVREGALEKLRKERPPPGKSIPVPILAFDPEEKR